MARTCRSLWELLTLAGILVSSATVVGFLGRFWWLFDLAAHFRVQYFVLLTGITGAMAGSRKRTRGLVFAAFALVNLGTIIPLYLGRAPAAMGAERVLRVVLLNVHVMNRNYEAVRQAVESYDPDLVVLQEVSPTWLQELRELQRVFPHLVTATRDDCFGIALFSKTPFVRSERVELGSAGLPSIRADLSIAGGLLTVLGTHPLPPVGAARSRLRNEQIQALSALVRDVPGRVVVLGDLNATPWCWPFTELLRQTGLRDSAKGWGLQTTWPAHSVLLRIPIDHILHSPSLSTLHREIGPDVGSDHFPVIVDLAVPRELSSGH